MPVFVSLYKFFLYYKNYPSHESCLKHIRIQLVTLFFTTSVLLSWGTRLGKSLLRRASKAYNDDPAIRNARQKLKKDKESVPVDIENISGNKLDTTEQDNEKNPLLTGKRKFLSSRSIDITSKNKKLTVNGNIIADAKYQLNLDNPPEVLDGISDLVTQFGYLTWFSFVFPCMPLQIIT